MNVPAGNFVLSSAPRQRGVVLIMVVVAMLALLAVTGLALDGSYNMLNKTRLQNVVDAAALSAAKTLNEPGASVLAARTEALAMFNENAIDDGNAEISRALADGEIVVTVEFSNTLLPFDIGSVNPPDDPAQYVRVTATNLLLDTWLMSVVGTNETEVEASAVAGPSVALDRICNVAPMMVCSYGNASDNYGYELNKVSVLKAGSANQDMERGNFQLIRLVYPDGTSNTGGADVRDSFAGLNAGCVGTTEPIETEPGNTVGPAYQGLNTRMNIYEGPMKDTQDIYPPDRYVGQSDGQLAQDDGVITYTRNSDGVVFNDQDHDLIAEMDWTHDQYVDAYVNNSINTAVDGYLATGKEERRVLQVPVGSCGNESGQTQIPFESTLCFYLLQEVSQGQDPDIFGQFIGQCRANGNAGPQPNDGAGPFVIQLYKDETRTES